MYMYIYIYIYICMYVDTIYMPNKRTFANALVDFFSNIIELSTMRRFV